MPDNYVMVTGGRGVSLAPEFDNETDADQWAAERGIYGTPMTVAEFKNTPAVQAQALLDAKLNKCRELQHEGDLHVQAVSPLWYSVVMARAIALGVKYTQLTPEGQAAADVAAAWSDAFRDIMDIVDIAEVQAYNVEIHPLWP